MKKYCKRSLVVFLLISFSSCSSMRLRYDAEIETEGESKQFQYESSVEVGGGIPTLCVLTGIFFGGACWYYLVMPTVTDQRKLEAEADVALKKELPGKPYTVKSTRVHHLGWKNESAVVRWPQ